VIHEEKRDMSVIVIGRFQVPDVARAKQVLAANAALLEEITEDAKGLGARHHQFLEGNGELVILDEWESAEGFQRFFESNTKIPRITQEAGAQGPPKVEVLSPVEAAGTF
jgi:quinol monooxygenase YgiN